MKRSLLLLLFASSTFAQAPLPEELREAKTVYIDNQTGNADIADRAFKEIKKAKRFTVVADRDSADLVFTLTFLSGPARAVTEVDTHTTSDEGHGTNTSGTLETQMVQDGSTRLAIYGQSDDLLYMDTKRWGNTIGLFGVVPLFSRSATVGLIRDFHKRLKQK